MIAGYSAFTNVNLVGDHIYPTTTSGRIDNISVAKDTFTFMAVDVPLSATNLTVSISGGTGDADLYVKHGSQPTTTDYDCRPYKSGNVETCSLWTQEAGLYHIGLRGYAAGAGVTLVWSYQ
ncbi:MAG: pre-peptidase C-terminal domain-containing protein [Algicola sp.]|nr:pre-peptidase C-terminal domain-containing protein [Algicola sp.]